MIGFTPVPCAAFHSWTAPAMLPWSVSVTAGISNSAARPTRSGTRHAPSRIEYSEWTWRWTKGAAAIGRNSLRRPPDGPPNGSITRSPLHHDPRPRRSAPRHTSRRAPRPGAPSGGRGGRARPTRHGRRTGARSPARSTPRAPPPQSGDRLRDANGLRQVLLVHVRESAGIRVGESLLVPHVVDCVGRDLLGRD